MSKYEDTDQVRILNLHKLTLSCGFIIILCFRYHLPNLTDITDVTRRAMEINICPFFTNYLPSANS